jgi:hypothetical protein
VDKIIGLSKESFTNVSTFSKHKCYIMLDCNTPALLKFNISLTISGIPEKLEYLSPNQSYLGNTIWCALEIIGMLSF